MRVFAAACMRDAPTHPPLALADGLGVAVVGVLAGEVSEGWA